MEKSNYLTVKHYIKVAATPNKRITSRKNNYILIIAIVQMMHKNTKDGGTTKHQKLNSARLQSFARK